MATVYQTRGWERKPFWADFSSAQSAAWHLVKRCKSPAAALQRQLK
jgi:hypothetical protein